MKYTILVVVIAVLLIAIDMDQTRSINNKLSSFVGFKAKAQWVEQMSNGETKYLTKWNTCTAIVGEKNNIYYFITPPVCFK